MSPKALAVLLALPAVLFAERLSLELYTSAGSLPDNTARPLLASSQGYLWAASGPHLLRFDGHAFRTYSTADGWTGGRPLCMTGTASGEFYIGAGHGVFRFDPNAAEGRRFSRVELPGPASDVHHLLQDSQNRLWAGAEEGAYRREPDGRWRALTEIKPVKPQHSHRVERFAEDRLGDVWVASYSGIYCYRRNGEVERYSDSDHPQLNDSAMPLIEGPDRKIYVGTENGLFRLARASPNQRAVVDRWWSPKDGLPSLYVAALAFWKGNLWAGTIRGAARIDPAGRVEEHTELAGIKEPPVEALLLDRDGSLWIGSDGAGLMVAVNRGFTNFNEKDGLAFSRIEQVLEDRNGELIAVSKLEQALALNRFNGQDAFEPFRPRFPKGAGFSWAWSQIALHSSARDWWFGSDRGPIVFRAPALATLGGAAPELSNDPLARIRGYVFRLFEDSRGGIWMSIGGRISHLLHHDPVTRRWRRFDDEPKGYTAGFDNYAAAFAEDPAGNIWIGNLARGLYRYRAGRIEPVTVASEIAMGPRSLHVDRSGRLWIGTKHAGVLRIDNPNADRPVFQKYQTGNGLSSDSTACVTSDRSGDIYVCTGRGIDRLQPATGRVRSYTTADGLIGGTLRAGYRDRHGALWFASTEGVARFIPTDRIEATGPKVIIQGLRVAARTVSVPAIGVLQAKDIRIEPNEQRLQVDYVAFDPKARYQHRLEGVNEWSAPSVERTVLFEGLAPGDYRFEVRGISEAGAPSPEPATVYFHVVPPFWRRWWFLLMMAAATGLAAYAFHRYRLGQLLALERVRLQIASDLHDDIGSSLSQVSMLGELARRSLNGASPGAADLIDRMATASREAVSAMGDIVWSIHPRHDRLSDLVQRMRGFASDVLSAREIDFDFDAPGEAQTELPPGLRRDLLLIFKESVNNAARHSGCRRVHATLALDGGRVRLTVEDDGRGFDSVSLSSGHGLDTMRTRARKLGGECEVRPSSGGGGGTVVAVSIPLAVSYSSK
jgi:signal transduction histidine kinase/ligand-binding sensor domain-containing protein